MSSIDKRLVPNLRRLKISSKHVTFANGLLDRLFDCDVLFSLTNFTLVGMVIGLNVLRNLLSMLGHQCSYAFDVRWSVPTAISLSDTSDILLDMFRQLKGRVPIELSLELSENSYSIEASTTPRMNKSLDAYGYLKKNIVRAYVEMIYFLMENCVFVNLDKVDGHIVCHL